LPEDEWGIVRVIWNEFPWWSVLWRIVAWTLLGAIAGLFVGVSATVLLRRWGAYRLPWPRVRFWLQLLLFVLNIIAMPLIFGAIGFFEGLYRSSEVAVRRSVIGKEWLPKIAEVGADAIAFADAMLEKEEVIDWDEVHQKKRPVNVPRFLDRLDQLKAGAAEKISARAKEKLFEEHPEWKGEVAETVIDWTLPNLIHYLLNRKLHAKLKEYGVPDFLDELRREATKDGDDLMTHAEMTAFLTERVLIPMLLYPLNKYLSGLQKSALGLAAIWFATPVVLYFLTRWIVFLWKRRQARKLCPDLT
jgi:hypothetical protein